MRAVQRHLTYANVVATICLFIVLGGSAYAVTTLPSGSVGSKQLRTDAVSSTKVKNGSLLAKDFKKGQLPKGPQGPRGATGPAGPQGTPGPFADTLPPGVTLRGAFILAADAAGDGGHGEVDPKTGEKPGEPAATQVSWGFRLSAPPEVHIIPVEGGGSLACPGSAASPEAGPGHVCLYQTYVSQIAALHVLADSAIDSRYGLGLFSNAMGPGLNEITGTWAVTGS